MGKQYYQRLAQCALARLFNYGHHYLCAIQCAFARHNSPGILWHSVFPRDRELEWVEVWFFLKGR